MFFRLSFVTLIFATVALGTPVKRDMAEVASDIQNLAGPLQALDTAINALPDSEGTLPEIYMSVPQQLAALHFYLRLKSDAHTWKNIHQEATKVEAAVKTTTNNVNVSSTNVLTHDDIFPFLLHVALQDSADFTDAESATNNERLAELVPLVEKALDVLVAKKPTITTLNTAQIAKDDLETLKADTDALGSAILAKTPVRLSLLE